MSTIIRARDYDAAVFDLDGVLTRTASVHARAWKQVFDDYLASRTEAQDPFDDADYRRHVDGKPRCEGVQSFLVSRGIELPWGDAGDPPGRETVCGLGSRKNQVFQSLLREQGATVFDTSVRLVRQLRQAGVATGVVSSSRNCPLVLETTGLGALFDARVDGNDLAAGGLEGKPAPDMFLEAARQLGAGPDRALVVEDSVAGVKAGRCGGFATVIGVARGENREALEREGADVVVADLGELSLEVDVPEAAEPEALARTAPLDRRLPEGRVSVFLDYDGTLTPIVERPEDAVLPEPTRALLRDLAGRCPVAVISGRDLADVRRMVGLETLWYAGSHGFDIAGPGGEHMEHEEARQLLPELEAAAREAEARLAGIPGVHLERKGYALAVHYRQAAPEDEERIRSTLAEVAAEHRGLRRRTGKKIVELQPDLEWDKGRALQWLREALDLAPEVTVLYAGDDTTDEDAFAALGDDDVGILVSARERPSRARWRLTDPEAVRDLLAALRERLPAPD